MGGVNLSLESRIYHLIDQVKNRMSSGEISIEMNGHSLRMNHEIFYSLLDADCVNESVFEGMKDIIEGKRTDEFPLRAGVVSGSCSLCKSHVEFWFDGKKLYAKNACKQKEAPFSVDIPFPSGKLVMVDDLRSFFTAHLMAAEDDNDLNTFYGMKKTTELYHKEHVFHTFVGNSSPSYRTNNEKNEVYFGKVRSSQGFIDTNLRWITVVDYEILKSRAEKMGLADDAFYRFLNKQCEILHVESGLYRATSYYAARGDKKPTYAKMVRIGDAGMPEIVVLSKENKSAIDHPFIKKLNHGKYSSVYPSFSVLALLKFGPSVIAPDEKCWIDYNYKDHKLTDECGNPVLNKYGHQAYSGFMEVAKEQVKLLSISNNPDFLQKIPDLDLRYFLRAGPEDTFKYFGHEGDFSEINFPSKIMSFPYLENKYDLLFRLVFLKALSKTDGFEFFTKMSKENDNLMERIVFSMDIIYTNIVHRGIEGQMLSAIQEICSDEIWPIICGYSPAFIADLKEMYRFRGLQLSILMGKGSEYPEEFVEEKMKEALV